MISKTTLASQKFRIIPSDHDNAYTRYTFNWLNVTKEGDEGSIKAAALKGYNSLFSKQYTV